MANRIPISSPEPVAPTSSGAPSSSAVCPGCGQGVDPLRAGHVAMLGGRFRYFCRADCKQAYLRSQGRPPEEDVATARPPEVAYANGHHDVPESHARPIATPAPAPAIVEAREPPVSATPEWVEGAVVSSRLTLPSPEVAPPSSRSAPVPEGRRGSLALEATAITAGLLVPALALLGSSAEVARVPLALVACVALVARRVLVKRDASDPHALVVLAPAVGSLVAAVWAELIHDPRAGSIDVLAGLTSASAVFAEVLVGRARARVVAARERVERELDARARVVRGDLTIDVPVAEVRPGEQVVLEAGDLVGVDATVIAGEARVVPWLDARVEVTKREGDPIVAGARVVSSRLRTITTWSGRERAWVRLLSTPVSRVDVAAPTARALRRGMERGAPVAALVVGLTAFAANASSVEILAAMCAGATAFGAASLVSLVALHFARAHLEALQNGITYKDAGAFERAGAVNLVVLSARGTVLLGEPEIVAVEPVGSADVERVLSLAAGAETASTHPFAAAVLRAARTRGVSPDPVRNATVHAGLGVTASASTGERLVVGGRGMMLEEKIGVAVTDARAAELESQGRSVLYVALGDRLLGLVALQDGLRPGARAAVQKLLDAKIEPVLMSGEARDTCETIGRALDIEHVRPEVLPGDRGSEVRALSEAGSVVAVIGHASRDDAGLGAADVAVAMGSAGSTPGEWAVALASDDVRDAATSLAVAHGARERARVAIALGAAPAVAALLLIGFGIAPLAVAPLAAALGAAAVAIHARESTRV
jgi:Cu+-exporting ATPase